MRVPRRRRQRLFGGVEKHRLAGRSRSGIPPFDERHSQVFFFQDDGLPERRDIPRNEERLRIADAERLQALVRGEKIERHFAQREHAVEPQARGEVGPRSSRVPMRKTPPEIRQNVLGES